MTETPSNNRHEPKFSDAEQCKSWLRGLPLTNVTLAHAEIVTQLTLLNRNGGAIAPLERLRILELLREPVAFLQGEQAKRYQFKPLPFGHADQATWDDVMELWQGMETGYRHCLTLSESEGELREHRALIIQRCLRYVSQRMTEHYHAYRLLPPALWRDLHALYSHAETAGIELQPLRDRLNHYLNATTCAATYVQALLTYLANPYQLAPRQLALVGEILDKWAPRCTLATQPPDPHHFAPISVNPAGDKAPAYLEGNGTAPRYLDTTRLGGTLSQRIKWLRGGRSKPQEVGLPEDCTQPVCEALLLSLYQLWCGGRPKRGMQRRKAVPKAELCFDFPATYFHLAGKPFAPPKAAHFYGVREMEDLRLFGHAASREKTAPPPAQGGDYPLEVWDIRDESAQGYGLERLPGKGAPILHYQLLAIRPFDSEHFALGHIRWLTFDGENSLQMGITLLPGIPDPVIVRVVHGNDPEPRTEPAFLLPEVAALREQASLVTPPGFYRPDALLEVFDMEGMVTVRLTAMLEKGADFERMRFTLEPANA